MRLLLDTHALLWWLAGDPRLSRRASGLIADEENDVSVSVASCWEIVIKEGLGRTRLPGPPATLIPEQLDIHGFQVLPIHLRHALGLIELPHVHRDPFDRMLVAQALAEELTLVSGDPVMARYPVDVAW